MKMGKASQLRGIIDLLLESESRINESKPIRYWYPLSLATYGTDEILEALESRAPTVPPDYLTQLSSC